MGKSDLSDLLQASQVSLQAAVDAALVKAPGKAFGAKLKQGHGRPVFKIKVLTPAGAVTKLLVDAGSGEVVHVKES